MNASRKSKKANRSPKAAKAKPTTAEDARFQDRLTSMLEWLADKDPVRAARLIGTYLDDLAEELSPPTRKPAKG